MKGDAKFDSRARQNGQSSIKPQKSFETNQFIENVDGKNFLPKIYKNIMNISSYNTKFRETR